MKKQEYLAAKRELERKFSHLKELLAEIEAAYIDSNKKFNLDEKVEVIIPAHTVTFGRMSSKYGIKEHRLEVKRFAFVSGFAVDYAGNISTRLVKCRRDGSISKHLDYAKDENIYEIIKE